MRGTGEEDDWMFIDMKRAFSSYKEAVLQPTPSEAPTSSKPQTVFTSLADTQRMNMTFGAIHSGIFSSFDNQSKGPVHVIQKYSAMANLSIDSNFFDKERRNSAQNEMQKNEMKFGCSWSRYSRRRKAPSQSFTSIPSKITRKESPVNSRRVFPESKNRFELLESSDSYSDDGFTTDSPRCEYYSD